MKIAQQLIIYTPIRVGVRFKDTRKECSPSDDQSILCTCELPQPLSRGVGSHFAARKDNGHLLLYSSAALKQTLASRPEFEYDIMMEFSVSANWMFSKSKVDSAEAVDFKCIVN
jgi:hypothetical protein